MLWTCVGGTKASECPIVATLFGIGLLAIAACGRIGYTPVEEDPQLLASLKVVPASAEALTPTLLLPAFDPLLQTYDGQLSFAVGSVVVTATAVDPTALIEIEGVAADVGAVSEAVSIAPGTSELRVNVTGDSGSSYLVRLSRTTAVTPTAFLKSSSPGAGDLFGSRIEMWGDTFVASAQQEDSGSVGINGDPADNSAGNSGAVYVFRRDDTGWSQEAFIKASNPDPEDLFSFSLALSKDTLVVGAFNESSSGVGIDGAQGNNALLAGAVYVFVRRDGRWSQEAYIKASNTESGDHFGHSVALFGDTLAVGAPVEDSAATKTTTQQTDPVPSTCSFVATACGHRKRTSRRQTPMWETSSGRMSTSRATHLSSAHSERTAAHRGYNRTRATTRHSMQVPSTCFGEATAPGHRKRI